MSDEKKPPSSEAPTPPLSASRVRAAPAPDYAERLEVAQLNEKTPAHGLWTAPVIIRKMGELETKIVEGVQAIAEESAAVAGKEAAKDERKEHEQKRRPLYVLIGLLFSGGGVGEGINFFNAREAREQAEAAVAARTRAETQNTEQDRRIGVLEEKQIESTKAQTRVETKIDLLLDANHVSQSKRPVKEE